MGLEAATYINQLVATNPVGATDSVQLGDDHIRLLKATIQATFQNITGAITVTQNELNWGCAGYTAPNTLGAQFKSSYAESAGPATAAIYLTSAAPGLGFEETDAAANNKLWDILANASVLSIRVATDAGAAQNLITMSRSGGNPTAVTVPVAQFVVQKANDTMLIEANAATLRWRNPGGATNEKNWRMYASATQFLWDTLSDDLGSATTICRATRSGISIGTVNFENGTLQYGGREVGYRNGNENSQAAGYTFVKADHGRSVSASSAGNFTVPPNVFANGDMITFINTTGANCTLVQGSGVTLRLMGAVGTTGNRTCNGQSVTSIYFQSGTVALVGGPGCS